MLFNEDDIKKSVGKLSGGEISRLLFAKLMLDDHNLLILDEPTNHLDMEAINALAQALQQYTGTTLIVSHDRNFLENACQRIIILKKPKVLDYKLMGTSIDKLYENI